MKFKTRTMSDCTSWSSLSTHQMSELNPDWLTQCVFTKVQISELQASRPNPTATLRLYWFFLLVHMILSSAPNCRSRWALQHGGLHLEKSFWHSLNNFAFLPLRGCPFPSIGAIFRICSWLDLIDGSHSPLLHLLSWKRFEELWGEKRKLWVHFLKHFYVFDVGFGSGFCPKMFEQI